MKRLMVGLLAGSLAVAMSGVALATDPVGGCPAAPDNESGLPGWTLFEPIGDDVKFDKNGDGYICVKGAGQAGADTADPKAPGNSITTINLGEGTFGAVVKDNNRKLP